MTVQYAKVTNSKEDRFAGNIYSYMTVDGYTKRTGAPMDYKVQIQGERRWYRVYNYCCSNVGTLFIKTKTDKFVVVQIDYETRLPLITAR